MRIFPKRRSTRPNIFFPAMHVLRGQLHRMKMQAIFMLSKQENKMTLLQKKIAISVFLFLMGFLLIGLLYGGLLGADMNRPSYLDIPRISQPISPQLPDSIQDGIRRRRALRLKAIPTHPDTLENK